MLTCAAVAGALISTMPRFAAADQSALRTVGPTPATVRGADQGSALRSAFVAGRACGGALTGIDRISSIGVASAVSLP